MTLLTQSGWLCLVGSLVQEAEYPEAEVFLVGWGDVLKDNSGEYHWDMSGSLPPLHELYATAQALEMYSVSGDELFARFNRAARVASGFIRGTLITLVILAMGVAILGFSAWASPLPGLVAFGVAGGGFWLFRATPQLWHFRARSAARRMRLVALAVGKTPLTRNHLFIGPNALILTGPSDVVLAILPKANVEAIAIAGEPAAVGLVIALGEGFLELPVILKVDGPAAQYWSIDGALRGRLYRAVELDLLRLGYPVARAGR
jgi:hypothetical protein